jgi:hypothetical protein
MYSLIMDKKNIYIELFDLFLKSLEKTDGKY